MLSLEHSRLMVKIRTLPRFPILSWHMWLNRDPVRLDSAHDLIPNVLKPYPLSPL